MAELTLLHASFLRLVDDELLKILLLTVGESIEVKLRSCRTSGECVHVGDTMSD